MALFLRVKEYLLNSGIEELIEKADAVLVAYSGGADSCVLLHFLSEYLKDKNIRLAAAHLNHMIRGEEAERDQQFCKKTAEALGVEFYTKKCDIPKIARERGETLEEAARHERYAFLEDIADSIGETTLIATAHNSTDNLETLIFNLARGSGTAGMGGIAPIRQNIIRPLLSVSGKEIRDYAEEKGIEFVVDSTNADTAYTRNHIRKNIVPLLKEINPQAEDAALRLAEIARSESEFIYGEAEKLILGKCIEKERFSRAHEALRARALQTLYKRAAGAQNGLSAVHLHKAVDFAASSEGELSLPGGYALYVDKDVIYVEKKKSKAAPEQILLEANGNIVPFGDDFAVALCKKGKEPVVDANIYNLFIQQSACFDTIYGSLFVRCRREGDRILTCKMHKKLKKLMCDKGIPHRFRESLPIFCDDSGILWAPMVALRDKANGDDITMYVFTLKGNL